MSDKRGNTLLGGLGVLMVLCCAVAPAAIGAIAGAAVGGWIGVVAAAALAVGVALLLRRRRDAGC